MQEEIYNSPFAIIKIDKTKNYLTIIWEEETINIQDDEYRNEILNYVSIIEKYQPSFIIDDARLYGSAILPETQEWVGKTTSEVFQKYIKKYAMIMPEEFFANLSADLNIDEVEKLSQLNIQQFKTIEEALAWLELGE